MARILIVDDDPDIIEATRMYLENAGYEVTSASNPADGLRQIQSGPVDLLVLDIMMEEFDDGIAMAQDLRKNGFTQPILMMSSISAVTGLPYDANEAVLPVNAFVQKPVTPSVLVEKVRALLAQSGEEV